MGDGEVQLREEARAARPVDERVDVRRRPPRVTCATALSPLRSWQRRCVPSGFFAEADGAAECAGLGRGKAHRRGGRLVERAVQADATARYAAALGEEADRIRVVEGS